MRAPAKAVVLAHDRPAPRYTSYPPATQFADCADAAPRREGLQAIAPGERVSLYVHVPFCAELCYYCGCFTAITRKPERVARYLDTLKEEARRVAALMPSEVSVRHVHFGGGSPTMLEPAQFTDLMETLRARFPITADAEIALEADPRQLTEEKVAAYAACGVNRMSFGVQDFDQKVLTSVNRAQPAALTRQAIGWCRAHGITGINFDLMYGLPYQTVESLSETVRQAVELAPSRIAFFGYAHVPWMKKHMKAMDMAAMPDGPLRYDLFKTGSVLLEAAGYHPVGIDHFVRADDAMYRAWRTRTLKRNFQGYTTDVQPVLVGLGASAISKLPDGYFQNRADIAAYEAAIAEGGLPPVRGYAAAPGDEVEAAVIESLMCYFDVDLADFAPDDAETRFADARRRLEPLIADGLVAWDGTKVRVLCEPQLMVRLVASAFDRYTPWPEADAAEAPQRHARAV